MDAPRIRDWPGPLDVGALAAEAVERARAALERLARSRGIDPEVGTSAPLIVGAFDAIGHLRIDGRPATGWAPLSGFVEAADGWVRLHGNFPHHADAIRASLQFDGPEDLARVVGRLAAAEVEERVQAAGGIATVVRTPEQWQAHPHHLATQDDPWQRTVTGDSRRGLGEGRPGPDPASTGDSTAMPLAGVRVLDLTRVIAGPVCSQLLGCLGADVLRLDPPQRPELLDHYLSHGMGKRSAELDLADHLDLLHTRLLPEADVVLLGYRPGALTRLGLDPQALAGRHPHLVVGSLSAWGEHGPWGGKAGFDSIMQAATGIATVCGRADQRPGALPVQALDHSSGYVLAAGVLDLLADARAGRVHVNLLGAARDLLARRVQEPAPEQVQESEPQLPSAARDAMTTIDLDTPHGRVRTVPVPITLDGRPLTAPISPYGSATPEWTTP